MITQSAISFFKCLRTVIGAIILANGIALPAFSQNILFAPLDTEHLYAEAQTPFTVDFHAPEKSTAGQQFSWKIINYDEAVAAEGHAIVSENKTVSLSSPGLPAGYYEIIFPALGSHTSGLWIYSSEAADQLASADPFFAVDAAMSWVTRPPQRPAALSGLPHLLPSGAMIRERLRWAAISPEPTRNEWETRDRNESLRRTYADAGHPVLEMFHDIPAWLKDTSESRFPGNLLLAAQAWRPIAKRWHTYWGALEVWNEPDIQHFGDNFPADQYVPLLKTIRYAMHDEGIDTPLGGGVFALWNPAYIEIAALNGLLDASDFIAFHYYGDPLGIEPLVTKYRDWLAQYDQESKPLWITEVGLSAEGGRKQRTLPQHQAPSALAFAMQTVESRACGITRHFPFIYPDYNRKGSMNYGMLDPLGTPVRAYAAYAQAVSALSNSEYAGDVSPDRIPGAKRVRVFTTATAPAAAATETRLVVIYTGQIQTGATIDLPFPALSAQGIDGRDLLEASPSNTQIAIPDGIVYLQASAADLTPYLEQDTEAMRLNKIAQQTPPALPVVSPIVLQPQVPSADVRVVTPRGYYLPPDKTDVSLQVWVNNLSDSERRVVLYAPDSTPQSLSLQPHQRQMVSFDIDINTLPASRIAPDLRLFTINAIDETTENGEPAPPVAPAAVSFIPTDSKGLAGYLEAAPYQFAFALGEIYRWDTNANGSLTLSNPTPSSIRYDVAFAPGVDRWAYPRIQIPQEVDFARTTAVLVRARCTEPAAVRLMTWDDQNKRTHTDIPMIPADGDWHIALIPLDTYLVCHPNGTPLREITRLSIGINSESDNNAIEISDLYLIGQ